MNKNTLSHSRLPPREAAEKKRSRVGAELSPRPPALNPLKTDPPPKKIVIVKSKPMEASDDKRAKQPGQAPAVSVPTPLVARPSLHSSKESGVPQYLPAAVGNLEAEIATVQKVLRAYRSGMSHTIWFREVAILTRQLRRGPWSDPSYPQRCLRVIGTLLQEVRCGTHTMKICLVLMSSVAQIREGILAGPTKRKKSKKYNEKEQPQTELCQGDT